MDQNAASPSDLEAGTVSRRALLGGLAAGVLGLAGGARLLGGSAAGSPSVVSPGSRRVLQAEQARLSSGRTLTRSLTAEQGTVTVDGRSVQALLYDRRLPGPEVRLSRGDLLDLTLHNGLSEPTSVHWHGLALRNDMDGMPGVTQPPIAPGGAFRYRFTVPDAGTYFFHPHSGLQLDQGLATALVVEDPSEQTDADVDQVLLLDDWTLGFGKAPAEILAGLQAAGSSMAGMPGMGGMAGMSMPDAAGGSTAGSPLGADGGDVAYPLHLVNGQSPDDPFVVRARPGQQVRLRLVNAAADSAYRVAVGGHRLTVTHADGFPVEPVRVDTLLIGMGERYDVTVTAGSGVFPIVAVREGKQEPAARALLRTAPGSAPSPSARPAELTRRLLTYADLKPVESVRLPDRRVDTTRAYDLGLSATGYTWTLNGRTFDPARPDLVEQGQRVRLSFVNKTSMFHPMHLHGHTFALTGTGVRKDTVIVPPLQTVTVDVQADNPGQWMLHCHNAYHLEAGMATMLDYAQ